MKILITGSEGLIGKHLCNFLRLKHDLILMDKKFGEHLDISNMRNFPSMKLEKEIVPDMIIHCAAFCRIRDCIKDPDQTFMDNIQGTYNVMEYARRKGIKKVILFSSSRVEYPEENIYTVSKKFMENLAVAYQRSYDIDYIIIRPCTVYGSMDFSDRLIPRFINNAKRGKELEIYGDHLKTLSFMHVDDLLEIIHRCVIFFGKYRNQVYNVATETISVSLLAAKIIKIFKSKSKIEYYDPELTQPQNVDQKHTFVDYIPQIDIYEGIKRTVGGFYEFITT